MYNLLRMEERRASVEVDVGGVKVGGRNPVVVQSMTNTPTEDVQATVEQVIALFEAGSQIVRLTVNSEAAARAVPVIVRRLQELKVNVPLVGDFHYNGHLLLTRHPQCARDLAKYRINPGNVGMGKRRDKNFSQMIDVARENQKAVRIGVNWGSLDQRLLARLMDENAARPRPRDSKEVLREAIVTSALESAQRAEEYGLPHDRIILSAKVSSVPELIQIYRELAASCDYPLHLGLTEAGMGTQAIVSSTAALAILLEDGIGDTIRISLTPRPGGQRTEEVLVAQHILQALGIRNFAPQVTACPGCGRTTSSFFQELAEEIQGHLLKRMRGWKEIYPGVEELTVAVMGCVVNGPGESKHADIGISLPGTGEDPKAPVYVEGEHVRTLKGPRIAQDFIEILEEYVVRRYAPENSNKVSV